MDFSNLFSEFTFKDWFSIIISLFVTIWIFIYQKNKSNLSDKKNDELLNFISNLKEKDSLEINLENLKEKQLNLEKQIREELPILAKQSVLKEQQVIHEKALYLHYKEWITINNELDKNSIKIQLDKELENNIIEKITPKFELLNKLDDLKTKITLSSIIIAISSTFIASPFNFLIAIPLLIFILKNLYTYLKIKGISDDFLNDFKIIFDSAIYVLLGGISIFSMVFIFIFVYTYIEEGYSIKNNYIYILIVVAFILSFIAIFLWRKKDNIFLEMENYIRKNL